MTALATSSEAAGAVTERPPTEDSEPRLFETEGATLEDVILGAWEALLADGRTECPVCGSALSVHGCAGCGSELS